MKESDLSPEQKRLKLGEMYSVQPLAISGFLDLFTTTNIIWQPLVTFFFAMLVLVPDARFHFPKLIMTVWGVGSFLLVVLPTLSYAVVVLGVLVARCKTRVRWPAAVFWSWWPFWRCVMVWGAGIFGTFIGNYIWYNQFLPHNTLSRMQSYADIDAHRVNGMRLQDAGIVTFNNSIGVDRTKAGCLKNGATWCVAPIVLNGKVPDVLDSSKQHTSDLFMAGVDCCKCPGEFRCGDWNKPGALGGYRVVDEQDRRFFLLAASAWSTAYRQTVRHPIFFHWVQHPVNAYHDLAARGRNLLALACCCVPLAIYTLTLVQNGLFKFLYDLGFADPKDVPIAPDGLFKSFSQRLAPQMYEYAENEKLQQDSPPIVFARKSGYGTP